MCAQKRLARGGDVKKCAQKSRREGNVRTFAFGEVARRRGGEVARWRFHPLPLSTNMELGSELEAHKPLESFHQL